MDLSRFIGCIEATIATIAMIAGLDVVGLDDVGLGPHG
jgi:hypothetical protein